MTMWGGEPLTLFERSWLLGDWNFWVIGTPVETFQRTTGQDPWYMNGWGVRWLRQDCSKTQGLPTCGGIRLRQGAEGAEQREDAENSYLVSLLLCTSYLPCIRSFSWWGTCSSNLWALQHVHPWKYRPHSGSLLALPLAERVTPRKEESIKNEGGGGRGVRPLGFHLLPFLTGSCPPPFFLSFLLWRHLSPLPSHPVLSCCLLLCFLTAGLLLQMVGAD